jgi:hypothetical protein
MKRYQKILLKVGLGMVAAFVLLVAALVIWALTPAFLGISHHNGCIRKAQAEAVSIEVKCTAMTHYEDKIPKAVTVTDPEKIHYLLSRLSLPQKPRIDQCFHGCSGNLAVFIHTRKETYELHYDHGNGMCPICRNRSNIGFIDMDRKVCAELNQYFAALGFTKDEIGYP